MIKRLWKRLWGYRRRWCVDCKKETWHYENHLVGWTCDDCHLNEITAELFNDTV